MNADANDLEEQGTENKRVTGAEHVLDNEEERERRKGKRTILVIRAPYNSVFSNSFSAKRSWLYNLRHGSLQCLSKQPEMHSMLRIKFIVRNLRHCLLVHTGSHREQSPRQCTSSIGDLCGFLSSRSACEKWREELTRFSFSPRN